MNAFNTKISRSKQGPLRFPKHDKPFDNSVKTMKLTPEQMDHYLKTGELPDSKKEAEKKIKHFKEITNEIKKKRGRPKKMVTNEQDLEKVNPEMEEVKQSYTDYGAELELQKLEQEVAELKETNYKLKFLLDDLQAKYNQLAIDYETAEQVKYDLTRTKGQLQQLRISKKETEEILKEESDKREALERLVRLYV